MAANLDRIFKAYDIRGVVPDDLDADIARRIGAAFAEWSGASAILLGRDCRLSSPELGDAISRGATSRGVDVVDLGLISTDLLYFASGSQDLPGVMLTASHNPKQYNGLKFCLAGAKPVGEETGLRRDPRDRRGSGARRPPRTQAASSSATCSRPTWSTCCRSWMSARCVRSSCAPTPPTAWAASWFPR